MLYIRSILVVVDYSKKCYLDILNISISSKCKYSSSIFRYYSSYFKYFINPT